MELSEPEQVTARFQAVVLSLLTPDSGAQLLTYSPQAVRITFNADLRRRTTVQVLVRHSQGKDPAALKLRVQRLLAELVASRSDPKQPLQPCVKTGAWWLDQHLHLFFRVAGGGRRSALPICKTNVHSTLGQFAFILMGFVTNSVSTSKEKGSIR